MRTLSLTFLVLGILLYAPAALARDSVEDSILSNFAAQSLEKLNAAQDLILALKGAELELAVLAAGGALNEKFQRYAADVKEGRFTPAEIFQIFGLATHRLASLTGEAGFEAATNCHTREALALLEAVQAGTPTQQHCRRLAYGTAMQSRAIKISHGPRAEMIDALTNEWATHTVLFAERAVRLDRK